MIGKIINGRYRLDAVLGHGGMGAVYRGHDLELERDVAIKLLNQIIFIKNERDRLLHEAKLIAKLRHPNIVSVYDVGESESSPFFVLEFVNGGSLRDLKSPDLDDILKIIIQICRGLDAAHNKGIIHHDLKPENVLLEKNGIVKIVDFGIARSDITRFTSEAQFAGTANYLAPEIAKGEEVDGRADLYSLGIIMYELTTGQLPLSADSLMAVINKHLFEEVVSPVEVAPDLPIHLNDLILSLLSKEPDGRPPSASALLQLLESRQTSILDLEASEFPEPIRTKTSITNHNLIAQPSTFIGRQDDLIQIGEMLADANCRLLTLVGIGGIGKTRLATQTAYNALNKYTDGVWMVELASLTESEFLPQQVASVLGVSAQEARDGHSETDVLVDFLRDKSLLLVIDNCEHLVKACAEFADTLLKGCPNVKLLATSREDLRIPGETLFNVTPMELPPDHSLVESIETYEAVHLFIERAVAIQHDFRITSENEIAVAQICHQLDGIPLAIELAAARIKVLTPSQIADRLGDRFQLLTSGSRAALPRHQTLEAAIDWSYDLLSDQEQVLLRRLTVFSGGWTLEAAEEVAYLEKEAKGTVLDLISQLVDKSLVYVEPLEHTIRYRMLETVRQYGINKLREQRELEKARQDHLDYFVQLAEEMDKGLRDERQIESLEVLDIEHDNLRRALRHSIDRANPDLAFKLVGALGWFWFIRGYWKESWIWLNQSLDIKTGSDPLLRVKAIYRAGGLELIRGKLTGTTELVEESLTTCREMEDSEGSAWCLNLLGQAGTWGYKEIEEADARLSESFEIFGELDDDWGLAWSLRYLGQIAEIQGDFEKSISMQRDALDRFEEIGDIWNSAHSLNLMGGSMYQNGDSEEAKLAYEHSLEKCSLVEDKVMAAHALRGLALIALQRNDLDQAKQLSLDALEALQKIGDENCASGAIRDLGEIARRQGEFERAADLLRQSLLSYVEMGNKVPTGITIERFASLAGSMGNDAQAALLLAAVEKNIGDTISSSPTLRKEHKMLVASTQESLGSQVFEQLWSKGAEMDLKEAAALAMDEQSEE